jgi:hypothetical protein
MVGQSKKGMTDSLNKWGQIMQDPLSSPIRLWSLIDGEQCAGNPIPTPDTMVIYQLMSGLLGQPPSFHLLVLIVVVMISFRDRQA